MRRARRAVELIADGQQRVSQFFGAEPAAREAGV
jgi:hypothetical protein